MNAIYPISRKEVTALDADVPLLRPTLIRFPLSERDCSILVQTVPVRVTSLRAG
jgi:hypothetical protein